MKSTEKHGGKAPMMGKATTGSIPPAHPNTENKKERQKVTYAEPSILPCQPTSSKIKVKDLITDEQEDKEQAINIRLRTVWDRPILKPQFEWPHDPRMPTEWKEMISAMQAYEGTQPLRTKETYHQASDDEISEPEGFMNLWHPNPALRDHWRKQSTVRLKLGKQDTEFRKLHLRFEKPKNRSIKPNLHEVPQNLLIDKGKWRAEKTPPE
jgi:hypothetical protein